MSMNPKHGQSADERRPFYVCISTSTCETGLDPSCHDVTTPFNLHKKHKCGRTNHILWTGSTCLRKANVEGYWKTKINLPGYMKTGKFLDQLSYHEVSKLVNNSLRTSSWCTSVHLSRILKSGI